jgi:hypothetical protein
MAVEVGWGQAEQQLKISVVHSGEVMKSLVKDRRLGKTLYQGGVDVDVRRGPPPGG